MIKTLHKCSQHHIPATIIYLDQIGQITQRTIIVKRMSDQCIYAYCLLRKQSRIFDIDRILAAEKGILHHERKQNQQTYSWS